MHCDFCRKDGIWQEEQYKSKAAARKRKKGIGAWFPWNTPIMPAGASFNKESLGKYGIVTHHCCPDCFHE